MNVQINNFQNIYSKMSLSRTRQRRPLEASTENMTRVSENESASVTSQNTLSLYHVLRQGAFGECGGAGEV